MVENEQKLAFTKLKLIEIIFYYYKTISHFDFNRISLEFS